MQNSSIIAREKVPTPTSVALIGLALIVSGCQPYERKPLDLAATRDAWLARTPSDESARQFAQRLARAEGRTEAVFDPADGLTLAEAEPVALVFNRDLRLARLEANVTRVTADNAGLWDDPTLGVDIERIVSSVPDPWVVAGTVGLTIPISGRLAVEKAKANAEHAAQLQRVIAREWATRTLLRETWMQWSAEMLRIRLAIDQVQRMRDVAAIADRQEQAGVMSRIDARLFRVELVGNETDLLAAKARTRELELQLRDIVGLAPDAPVQFVENIAYIPRGIDLASLQNAMETDSPELAAIRTEYDAAEESLRLEVRKQYPDLTIGPGYGSDQGDERILLGLRLPLPLWNRNRQGVAQASANREVARGRFESSYEHLSSLLAIAHARFEAGRSVRQAIESQVLPLVDEQDADIRRVTELGRVDPLLILQALKSHYTAKLRLIDARVAQAIGAVRIDELVGPVRPSPLPSIDPASSPDPDQGVHP